MYKKENLNYLYQDLEPFIDTHTVALHYNKHYKTYLENLNQLLKENNFSFDIEKEELAKNIYNYNFNKKDDILFNLGGVINHELYFKSLSKEKEKLSGLLKKDLIEKYGSTNSFIEEFIKIALELKGSGYTFLELTLNNDLVILNRKDQDSPLFHGHIPLFTIDLWEHAYYINYENNKKEYLENIFKIVDFSNANRLYNKIKMTNEITPH